MFLSISDQKISEPRPADNAPQLGLPYLRRNAHSVSIHLWERMSRTEEKTDTAKVWATLKNRHALRDIIGLHIGAPIKEYVKG